MKIMDVYRFIFSVVLWFPLQITSAQRIATVSAKVDKSRILIGEPLKLTVETRLPQDSLAKFAAIDSISHFEFLKKPYFDTVRSGDFIIIKAIYTLTSFDSGRQLISSIAVSPFLKTDTIPVDVVFSPFDPNQDYHDIKDIIEPALPKKNPWWWAIGSAVLLLVAIIIYMVRRKNKAPSINLVPVTDPYTEALEQLELLQRNKPEFKIFHTRLVDIFRLYVFRKKGILSLQKTTADLGLQLKELNFTKEQFVALSQALKLSDLVKFAKYIPSDGDSKECFDKIKNSIMTLELTES